jgi:Domain of unknown function (DUF5667)/Domain of unknown function (DUF5666)
MMNDKLLLSLEECLSMLGKGSDLDACLQRFPEHAAELQPLLLASLAAKSVSNDHIPDAVIRRNKSKFLNTAAELREQKINRKSTKLISFQHSIRLGLAALLAVIVLALVGGTGLVNASSGSLPGDRLYPVKLTWEDIRLKFTFSQANRDSLENSYKHERMVEINALFSSKRSEKVKFFGQVEDVRSDQIMVSGITISIIPETMIDGDILPGVWASVDGKTMQDGVVVASKIKLDVPARGDNGGSSNNRSGPSGKEDGSGKDNSNSDNKSGKSGSSDGVTPSTQGSSGTSKPDNSNSNKDKSPTQQVFQFEGKITDFSGKTVVANNHLIQITGDTEIRGQLSIGTIAKIHGFVDENGKWIATRIEIKDTSGGGENKNNDSGGSGKKGPTKTP